MYTTYKLLDAMKLFYCEKRGELYDNLHAGLKTFVSWLKFNVE